MTTERLASLIAQATWERHTSLAAGPCRHCIDARTTAKRLAAKPTSLRKAVDTAIGDPA